MECLLESSLCKKNWKFGVNKVFRCFVSVAGSCNSYCSEALTSSGSCIDRDILCKESPDCSEVQFYSCVFQILTLVTSVHVYKPEHFFPQVEDIVWKQV